MKKVLIYDDYILYEDGQWFSLKTMKFLKPGLNSSGYERVFICHNGRKERVFTHLEVVKNFGDCNGNLLLFSGAVLRQLGLSVDHLDRNKHNNSSSNLEIVTHRENCLRKFRGV